MTPISLTMKGFMSFKDEFTFFFPTAPGLYYLRGDNQLEPRLGANGAGKSTLWSALYWLCFDTTPKGLRAGNIANWETGKGVSVTFEYEHSGAFWSVQRTWGPNTWTLSTSEEEGCPWETTDLAKSTDNPFLDHLKLAPSAFSHCILMAQRQGMFLDMKPEAKVSVLSDVLGLDAWIERSAAASKKAQEQDRKTRLLEQRVADLTGQLRAHSAQDYAVQAEHWEKERGARLDAVADRHAVARLAEKAQQVETDAARIQVESQAASHKEATFSCESTEQQCAYRVRAIDQLQFKLRQASADAEKLRADAESLRAWKCGACGQRLASVDLEVKSRKNAQKIQECSTLVATVSVELEENKKVLAKLSAGLDQLKQKRADARDRLLDAERALAGHQRALQFTSRDLDLMEDEGERIEKEVNPFTAMQHAQKENKGDIAQRLSEATLDLDDSAAEHALQVLWIKGFKEIRLFDMSSALTELEIEVNSSVSELGLQDWSISFALDRENAKGDVKRGFSVFVQSPANRRPVPWEAWSGGEGQRLRLAGTMGLSDLIRSQTGAGLALEVWDEPTDGLSPEGINDLLASLKDRAQREQRQIWVVDHRALGYGAFDGVYTVVKDATGSHIQEG